MAVRSAAVAGPIQGSAIRNACRMAERLDRVIEILRAKALWMTTFSAWKFQKGQAAGLEKLACAAGIGTIAPARGWRGAKRYGILRRKEFVRIP
jgi:hypothetical protein